MAENDRVEDRYQDLGHDPIGGTKAETTIRDDRSDPAPADPLVQAPFAAGFAFDHVSEIVAEAAESLDVGCRNRVCELEVVKSIGSDSTVVRNQPRIQEGGDSLEPVSKTHLTLPTKAKV
jgi:hypothetical protein